MSKDGEMTARLGNYLQQELSKESFTVHYDHGNPDDQNVGVISSIIGKSLQRGSKLTELDIAVLDKEKKAVFLIEIEESDDNPKKIIADVMATLIGDKIYFKEQEIHQIGEWTTLIIYAKRTGQGHDERIGKIEKKLNQLITNREIDGVKIMEIKLSLFQDEDDLKNKVRKLINTYSQKS